MLVENIAELIPSDASSRVNLGDVDTDLRIVQEYVNALQLDLRVRAVERIEIRPGEHEPGGLAPNDELYLVINGSGYISSVDEKNYITHLKLALVDTGEYREVSCHYGSQRPLMILRITLA